MPEVRKVAFGADRTDKVKMASRIELSNNKKIQPMRNGERGFARPHKGKEDKPKKSSHRPANTTSKQLSTHVRHERSVVPEVEEVGVDDDDKPATVRRIEWKGSSYSSCDPYRKPDGRF